MAISNEELRKQLAEALKAVNAAQATDSKSCSD